MNDGYQLNPDELRYLTNKLVDSLKETLASDKTLEEKHNEYCLYTITLLMFCTGARPIIDPFCFLSDDDVATGLISISDKTSNERSAVRIVGLCNIAKSQAHAYIKNLLAIASRIRKTEGKDTSLSNAIGRLANGHRNEGIPFFFLIKGNRTKSIHPSDIRDYLARYLALPANFGRHWLATSLHEVGASFEEISLILGHSPTPMSLIGPESELCYIDEIIHISNLTQNLIDQSGFIACQGIRPIDQKRISDRKLNPSPETHLSRNLGDIVRKQARDKFVDSISEFADKTLSYCKRIFQGENKDDEWEKFIRNGLFNNRFPSHHAWGSFLDWFESIGAKHNKLPFSIHSRIIGNQNSPIKENTLSDYQQTITIRNDWIDRLNHCHLDPEDLKSKFDTVKNRKQYTPISKWATIDVRFKNAAYRAAAVVLNAALFGGVANSQKLEAISRALANDIYVTKSGLIHLELIKRKSSNNQKEEEWLDRWTPDYLSSALMCGYLRERKNTEITANKITTATISLAKSIGINVTTKDVYIKLSKVASSTIHLEYPGFISETISGSIGEQLDPDAFVRLYSGKVPVDKPNKKNDRISIKWQPDLQRCTNSETSIILKKLRILLASHVKYERRRTNARLSEELESLSKEYSSAPSICHLVLFWASMISRNGTAEESKPAASTLKTYIGEIAKPLFTLVRGQNFLAMDALDYEALYLNVIDNGSQRDQSRQIKQLYSFHSHMEKYIGCEVCEWGAVWSNASLEKPKVDANIISYVEYLRALKIIKIDTSLSKRLRIQLSGMVIMMFHFGLRFSEAYKLFNEDFQYTDEYELLIVQIRNNIYANTKTEAGVRQVPLLTKLTDNEKGILREFINDDSEALSNNYLVGLMAEISTSTELVNKAKVNLYLNQVLKNSCNDQNVHCHHFRHGFISRIVAQILLEKYHSENNNLKYLHWQDIDIDLQILTDESFEKLVKSLSVMSGHAAIKASVISYLHSLDCIIHQGDKDKTLEEISETAFAELLGEKYRTYRGRSKNRKDNITHVIKKTNFKCLSNDGFREFDIDKTKVRFFNKIQKLKPSVVEQILHQVASMDDPKLLSPISFGINDKSFIEITEAAVSLEDRSGFEDYLTINLLSRDKDERIHRESRVSIAQHKRVARFIEYIDNQAITWSDSDMKIVSRASEIWEFSYQAQSRKISITNNDDAATYKDFLNIVGLNMVIDSTNTNGRNSTKIECINMSKKMKRERLLPRINYSIEFPKNKNNDLGITNEKELHKALFSLFTWSNVTNKRSI